MQGLVGRVDAGQEVHKILPAAKSRNIPRRLQQHQGRGGCSLAVPPVHHYSTSGGLEVAVAVRPD